MDKVLGGGNRRAQGKTDVCETSVTHKPRSTTIHDKRHWEAAGGVSCSSDTSTGTLPVVGSSGGVVPSTRPCAGGFPAGSSPLVLSDWLGRLLLVSHGLCNATQHNMTGVQRHSSDALERWRIVCMRVG
jgi:hypothetical protein